MIETARSRWMVENEQRRVYYVPVDGDVVLRPVDDVDHERVALPDLQRRPRELPVHRDDVVSLAQPLHRRLLDLDDEHKHKPKKTYIDQEKKMVSPAH